MVQRNEPSGGFLAFGMILFVGGGMSTLALLWITFGWQVAVIPVAAWVCLIGYRVCWVPADGSGNGNAGTGAGTAGVPYVVQLDPEDPDAGIPR